MKNKNKTAKKIYPLWLIAAGLAAGAVNGLLGAGGGIIIVFALAAYNKSHSKSSVRDNFATTVASVLPMSIISAGSYISTLDANTEGVAIFLLPAVLGGIVGAFLTDRINIDILKLIFAALTVVAGINMIIK